MKKYSVTMNGKSVDIYDATVSAMPFNKVWDGEQRNKSQTETAYFVSVDIEDDGLLEITVDEDFDTYEIRPLTYKIPSQRNGRSVQIHISEPMQFTFEPDGYHNALHIFVNSPCTKPEGNVIYYGKGEHKAGLIWLESNQTLYLDEGAVVYGVVYAKDAHDINIVGRGILDSSIYRRGNDYKEDGREIYNQLNEKGCIEEPFSETDRLCTSIITYNCKNVHIEGITIRDSMFWALIVRNHCENVIIDNIKIIGQWRYNSDGIDICASKNVTVKNCFIRTFDDCFVARGAYLPYETDNVENVVVENCVLWCDWGKSLEVWCGDRPCAIRNITFRNNYLIRICNIAISITTWFGSKNTLIENLSYENIYIDGEERYPDIEIESDNTPEYLPRFDFVPHILNISAPKIGKCIGNQHFEPATDFDDYNLTFRNISMKNIKYSGLPLRVKIEATEGLLEIYNLNFTNCDFEI